MRLKRSIWAFMSGVSSLLLSVKASAENAGENGIDGSKFGEVLVSFLYFAGVLILIYIILTLVSKWGKKHPDKTEEKDGKTEKNAENDLSQEENTENKDENNE